MLLFEIFVKGNRKNETIRNRIMNMYEDFVSEVNPKDLFHLLIQKGVMSAKDKQKMMNKATTRDRCRALLDHLVSCSEEDSFVVLREALQVDYPWIIKRLDACHEEEDRKTVSIYKSSKSNLVTGVALGSVWIRPVERNFQLFIMPNKLVR